MANYSIRDLENFTGIKAHTIRIWEKRYKVVEPKRTGTNIRYYTDNDLKKLLNVSILNKHGFKISNIVNLSEKDLNQKILNIAQTQNGLEDQIESLVLAMIDIDEQKFIRVFDAAVNKFGFESTIINLIYPFFRRIGILWQVGSINPAHEHFVSNLIRQKILVAISGLENKKDEKKQLFVLFMPEGDFHEMDLIFYYYLLKKNKQRVLYLGGSVPLEALNEIVKKKNVDYLVTSLVNPVDEHFLSKLSDDFPQVKNIFITGFQTEGLAHPLPAKIEILESAVALRNRLQSLV